MFHNAHTFTGVHCYVVEVLGNKGVILVGVFKKAVKFKSFRSFKAHITVNINNIKTYRVSVFPKGFQLISVDLGSLFTSICKVIYCCLSIHFCV